MRVEAFEDDSEAEGSGEELDIKELRAKKQVLARKVAEQQRRQDKIQVGQEQHVRVSGQGEPVALYTWGIKRLAPSPGPAFLVTRRQQSSLGFQWGQAMVGAELVETWSCPELAEAVSTVLSSMERCTPTPVLCGSGVVGTPSDVGPCLATGNLPVLCGNWTARCRAPTSSAAAVSCSTSPLLPSLWAHGQT